MLHLSLTRIYNPMFYYNRNNKIHLVSIKFISYRDIFHHLTHKLKCLLFKCAVSFEEALGILIWEKRIS